MVNHKGINFGKVEIYCGHRISMVFYRNISEMHCGVWLHQEKGKKIEYVNHKSEVFYICMFFATVPFFKTVLEFRFFCLGVKGKLSMKSAYM